MIELKNNADGAELNIFGEIGESWWGDTVSFKDFIEQLDQYKNTPLTINIDSPGGSVWDGNSIANSIKNRTAKTTCNIYSLCASIATQIALACDEVNMYSNSLFMIHLASAGVYGNKIELQKNVDLLDKMDNILADTYINKTGIEKEEMLQLMEDETWFDAYEAKDKGFIDNILDAQDMVAMYDPENIKQFKYNKVPYDKLKNIKNIKDVKKQEQDDRMLDIDAELIKIQFGL